MELTLIQEFLSAAAVAALILTPMLWGHITPPADDAWHIENDAECDSYEPIERRHPSLGNVPRDQ